MAVLVAFCTLTLCASASVVGAVVFTFTQRGLWPLRGVHFSVQVTAAVCAAAVLPRRFAVLVDFAGVAVRFLEEEAVLVLVLLEVFVAVFLLVFVVFWLVVALFFLSTVLMGWDWVVVVLACLEA